MHRQNKLRLQLLLGTALLAAPFSAFAQTAPAPADAAPAGLDDIVVTATKRETNLQDTPISISVLNSEALENRHVQSLMDLADGAVPGLRIATFEARQSALTIGIRGIVPNDANQPAREQGVGVYVDGVYLGRQHGLGAALLDVERIEVLKGPQGTLFGRNTEGGALSLVTRKPTGEFGMRAVAGVGNLNSYNSELHVDFPAIDDFAVKVDGVISAQGPVTKNPLPGEEGFGAYDRRGLRAQVRWTPTDNFTADLAADISKDKNTPFYSQLLNYNPNGLTVVPFNSTTIRSVNGVPVEIRALSPLVQVNGDSIMDVADIGVPQQWSVDDTKGVDLHLSYRPSDDLELRSITAYREVAVEQYDNIAGAHRPPIVGPNSNFSRYSLAGLWQHQFSQEFQAVGSLGDRIDYVGGLYYFKETASDDASTPSTNRWNADGTGYTILDPTPTIRGFRSIDRESRAESESKAIYGQATWTPAVLNDGLHITAGGRFTQDDKSGVLSKVSNAVTNFTFDTKTERFNPMVTVAYDVNHDVNVYAKYAEGYRAGGASSRSLTYRSFGPEDIVSYEMGLKSDWLDNRLRVNAAAFYSERENSQIDFSLVTVIGASTRNTLETINAPGTTKLKGVELEGMARVTDALTLSASYAYTNTEVPPTRNPFSGVVQQVFIAYTPKNAFSVAADYDTPLFGANFKAHIDANYADATQAFDQFELKNDSSFIVNGRVALTDITTRDGGPLLEVALWSRNLLDEQYVYRRDPSNRGVIGDYGNFNTPRTFGIELRATY
ncbi:TonB-dependent receptor [Brevundimonas sp.]|jgi:iron complex outermembrane receptor protein|uniref:TonB-dependent receptor n=1 Tax=Brevundimonas sp. TaxID=1871086 RepID=UPI0037BE2F5F